MTGPERLSFWETMKLLLPVAAGLATLGGTALLGGFADFQWSGQEPSPFAVFGILGTILFPGASFFAVQIKCDEAAAVLSRAWPTVTGNLLSSDVKKRSGPYATVYRLTVSYAYEVNGVAFTGDRLAFGPRDLSSEDAAERFARKYPPNTPVTVHYNAGDPGTAVLDTSDALVRQNTVRIWLLATVPFVGAAFMMVRRALQ
jgi:hypothetical protein